MEFTEIRLRGNDAYKSGDYASAIDLYSQVIDFSGESDDKVLAIGNRAACYLSLKDYPNAEADARSAVALQSDNDKYHFRLITSLRAQNKISEGLEALNTALEACPHSSSLLKMQQKVEDSRVKKSKKYLNDGTVAWGSGFGNNAIPLYCETVSPNGESPSGALFLESQAGTAYTDTQHLMLKELRSLVDSIQKGTFIQNTGGPGVIGKFQQLCDSKTFIDVVFPGASTSDLSTQPASLRDLLLWPELVVDMTQACKSAASVLDSVLAKGASMGDTMDAQTRSILIPQIAQEALARELITAVRNHGKNFSKVTAKMALKVATTDAPQAGYDMLDDDVVDTFYSNCVGKQEEYLGAEWAALVLDDVQRFASYERLTDVEGYEATVNNKSQTSNVFGIAASAGSVEVPVRMCWLERVYEQYPALSEAISKLYALPFELNKKRKGLEFVSPALKTDLLEPASRIALFHYRTLASQPPRLDSKSDSGDTNSDVNILSGGGSKDSGIRITAAYQLVPGKNTESAGFFEYSYSKLDDDQAAKGVVAVEHDTLVMHASTVMRNSRSPAKGEYFVLVFYIHGND